MCGRTACTLQKENIIKACKYTNINGKRTTPNWKDVHPNNGYNPSYNMAPGNFTPVLIKSTHINELPEVERILCPMKWGLIPAWYQGEINKFEYKTTNCQAETIENKPSYRSSIQKGRRCVVLADGFYEWKKLPNGKKQPYFIYLHQSDRFDMKQRKWKLEEENEWCKDNEWRGPCLLSMAGLFDIWKTENDELLYSYTIITVKASSEVFWLHNRMPAILNENDIQKWLDYDNVSVKEAIKLLHNSNDLEWYTVSTSVNNSRNNTIDCVLPINTKKLESPAKNKFLTSWLKTANKLKHDDDQESNKKLKLS